MRPSVSGGSVVLAGVNLCRDLGPPRRGVRGPRPHPTAVAGAVCLPTGGDDFAQLPAAGVAEGALVAELTAKEGCARVAEVDEEVAGVERAPMADFPDRDGDILIEAAEPEVVEFCDHCLLCKA